MSQYLDVLRDNQHDIRKHMSCESNLLSTYFEMTQQSRLTGPVYMCKRGAVCQQIEEIIPFKQEAAICARNDTIGTPQDNVIGYILFLTYCIGC